jgi:hypothetical protein
MAVTLLVAMGLPFFLPPKYPPTRRLRCALLTGPGRLSSLPPSSLWWAHGDSNLERAQGGGFARPYHLSPKMRVGAWGLEPRTVQDGRFGRPYHLSHLVFLSPPEGFEPSHTV